MEFRVLGPLEVTVGRATPVLPPRQRTLLALLLLAPGRVVPADRIVDELWPEDPPDAARASVQTFVSHLRKALGDRSLIRTRAPGYELVVSPDAIDASRFTQLAARGRELLAKDPVAAEEALARALDLWRGPAFADALGAPSVRAEASRLEEEKVGALEDLLDAALRSGRHDWVESQSRTLVAQHPFRERIWRFRMLALYRCGRQADALACGRELRDLLARELGIDPGPELGELESAILRHAPEAGGASASTPGGADSFVGREELMAEIHSLLGTTRLLTLCGPGGCGKTRVARELAAGWQQPVHVVELASVTGEEAPLERLAAAAGVPESPGRPLDAAVVAALRGGPSLIVLDNCEHVARACAALCASLLDACPEVTIVATSREPLGVAGERVLRVPPLALPAFGEDPSRSPAVRLFCDRALSFDARFDAGDLDAVAEVCRRLDGIPLAIELAAARVTVLAPAEIATRLDDALGLLKAGRRPPSVEHHRSLRAALEWSLGLLETPERELFARLSVFAGAFSVSSAEEVCAGGDPARGEVLDALSHLVDASIVVAATAGGRRRFRLMEAVRQLAREALEETDAAAVRDRHLRCYVALVSDMAAGLASTTPEAVSLLEEDLDDLLAAREWALEREPAAALVITMGIFPYWNVRGRLAEGRRRVEEAIAAAAALVSATELANAQMAAAAFAMSQGDLERAGQLFAVAAEGFEKDHDERGIARALLNLGTVAHLANEPNESASLVTRSVEAARRLGDDDLLMRGLNTLGQVVRRRGDLARALAIHEEALEVAARLGNAHARAAMLLNLGELERQLGKLSDARTRLELALEVSRELGFAAGIAASLGALGNIAMAGGELDAARIRFEESLALARDMGDRRIEAESLTNLASVLSRLGRPDAVDKLRAARAAYTALGDRRGAAQAALGMADRLLWDGRRAEAAPLIQEALIVRRDLGEPAGIADGLETAASLAVLGDQAFAAADLIGAADTLRQATGVAGDSVGSDSLVSTLVRVREALGPRADERLSAGRGLAVEDAVSLALRVCELASPESRRRTSG